MEVFPLIELGSIQQSTKVTSNQIQVSMDQKAWGGNSKIKQGVWIMDLDHRSGSGVWVLGVWSGLDLWLAAISIDICADLVWTPWTSLTLKPSLNERLSTLWANPMLLHQHLCPNHFDHKLVYTTCMLSTTTPWKRWRGGSCWMNPSPESLPNFRWKSTLRKKTNADIENSVPLAWAKMATVKVKKVMARIYLYNFTVFNDFDFK